MVRHRGRRLLAVLFAAGLLAGPLPLIAAPATRHATAAIRDASGGTVGLALFGETDFRGVRVLVLAWGLSAGLHGLHIHATGSCVAPDFVSAGSHVNPLNTTHGAHAGDLPNLPVGSSGFGHLVTTSAAFSLLPGQTSIFDGDGAALIVHANPDDYMTNPTGNSGARVACGVIAPLGFSANSGT
jgi:Cu-Zn family superoxide dismutase